MSFQRRLSHMAAVTKWKADQQMRLMRSQTQVRDLENQLEAQKLALADAVLAAHAAGSLAELDLTALCTAIDALKAQVDAEQAAHEAIKAEEPPELDGAAPTPAPVAAPGPAPDPVQIAVPPATEAMVAPAVEIGAPPEDPVVVIPPVEFGTPQPEPVVVPPPLEVPVPPAERSAVAALAQGSDLVCPECGRALSGRFCPEHGLEGVARPAAAPAPVPAKVVCPVCGLVLAGRFCPEHGVEGVPAPSAGA